MKNFEEFVNHIVTKWKAESKLILEKGGLGVPMPNRTAGDFAEKFIINKIEVLNHRWIIADFSNGDLWGEVLLQYFIEEDESLNFKIIQSTLYPKQ
jgi:hypothetical protein